MEAASARFHTTTSWLPTISRFKLDGFLLAGVERNAILDCPDRANRTHVCPLRAQERVQVQALGMV